jgi:hypothetical protein
MQLKPTAFGTGLAQRKMIFMADIFQNQRLSSFDLISIHHGDRVRSKFDHSTGFANLCRQKVSMILSVSKLLCRSVPIARKEST